MTKEEIAQKERPILFSAPMVTAILEGRKTQTRRVIKPMRGWEKKYPTCKPEAMAYPWSVWWHGDITDRVGVSQDCPYGVPGGHLWVREAWNATRWYRDWESGYLDDFDYVPPKKGASIIYRAGCDCPEEFKWRPSIYMPRWASRISLEITGVRVERLQQITESDAIAEGVQPWEFDPNQPMTSGELGSDNPYRGGFACLWDDINEHRTWKDNPWVWVVEFRRLP